MFIYIDVIFIIILNVYFIAVNTHGSEDTSKWITPHGSTAIKLHGQTIHFLPKNSNCKNAIEFFTHQNIEILNVPSKINDLIDPNIFNVFLQEFKEHNGFAVDCVNVGNFLLDWFDYKSYIEMETSGSTGAPKTISISKQAMVDSALATGDFFDLQPGQKVLPCLPTD